jgi:hypothetical protein
MKNHLKTVAALFLAGVMAATVAMADTRGELDHRARETLDQFYTLHHTNHDLAERAAGVLVFPRVTKGGLGVGASTAMASYSSTGKWMATTTSPVPRSV